MKYISLLGYKRKQKCKCCGSLGCGVPTRAARVRQSFCCGGGHSSVHLAPGLVAATHQKVSSFSEREDAKRRSSFQRWINAAQSVRMCFGTARRQEEEDTAFSRNAKEWGIRNESNAIEVYAALRPTKAVVPNQTYVDHSLYPHDTQPYQSLVPSGNTDIGHTGGLQAFPTH